MTRVWLVGGSGLVGGFVEARLAARGGLVSFGRRAPTQPCHRQIDFDRLPETGEPGGCDTAIACLGTTIRAAGSKSAMRRVDHDYVVAFAMAARAAGARQFILVSSVGADPASANFYLRLKGESERNVVAVGFERVDVIRPGLLLGDRRQFRPAERFAALLAPVVNPALVGSLARYRAIRAETVAGAIARLVGAKGRGTIVHEGAALRERGPVAPDSST
jgi:uncharacterized protein YbjT (DUF2867 family)